MVLFFLLFVNILSVCMMEWGGGATEGMGRQNLVHLICIIVQYKNKYQ